MIPFRYVSKKSDTKTKALNEKVFERIITDLFLKGEAEAARQCHLKGDKDGYEAHQGELPLIVWCGFNKDGKRDQASLTPTQYYIMDIDHANRPSADIWFEICTNPHYVEAGIKIAHATPSDGLRLVCQCVQDFHTIEEHQAWISDLLELSKYGDVDSVVKDVSRGSFMVPEEWIYLYNHDIWEDELREQPIPPFSAENSNEKESKVKLPEVTEEMRNFEFKGKRLAEIAEEYITDMGGVPTEGLRHNFYNELVKNFRNLCDNDPRIVFAVLPLCEGSEQKRWSQVTSICKTNNSTKIPKEFYFWLKNRGYIITKKDNNYRAFLESDEPEREPVPALPPIFKEFCARCPKDFIYPTIVALLPILGTLCSFVKALYYDLSWQTTTFFSCIWAPPASGKSFAKNLVEMLMKKIKLRDELNDLREQLWLVDERTRGKDDKGNDLPHVTVRIMPAINSMPEFLEKMRDNRGYHMFTMAEEVDTFKKGSSSGGADKSDMFRAAWDNSEYGQSFRSAGTFKGKVRLYYNILLTGTPGAVRNYYSNVEDGMVTRISICEIENQEFAPFQVWKPFTKKGLETIDRFIEKCDKESYQDPCETDLDEVHLYENNSKNYDENVKWKFVYKPRKELDMEFLRKTITDWLENTRIDASLAEDKAKDVFRRRVAVKGFRLGMVCMCCYANPKKKEQEVIKNFVRWFMDRDLDESLKFFGSKYNRLQEEAKVETRAHQSLFDALPEEFTKNDVIAQCIKQGIKSKVKNIIWRWKNDKAITKTGNNQYKKTSNKTS